MDSREGKEGLSQKGNFQKGRQIPSGTPVHLTWNRVSGTASGFYKRKNCQPRGDLSSWGKNMGLQLQAQSL
jgi:hypothetical protein